MTDLTAKVAAALERSVQPLVVARGGALRAVSAHGGVATVEMTGSPGAVAPLGSRIEAQVRAAVPQITSVRIVAPGAQPAPAAATGIAGQARHVLDTDVNPAIAAHHGHVAVHDAGQGWVHIRLEGGCQGCGLAETTVREGIEPLLRARLPGIVGVVDVTDHAAGARPFFPSGQR